MPSDEQMRFQIKKAYPGKRWAEKVDRMSKSQVAAIYLRLLDKARNRKG